MTILPLPEECYSDPLICQNVYGDFVELDLAKDIRNGLDVGTSGGDQFMVTEEAGPANDRRLAVRPSFGDIGVGTVLNFAILDGALGPSTQPNARLAIAPDPAGLRLSWPYRAPQNILQAAEVLGQSWAAFTNTLAIDDEETNSVKFAPSTNTQFFRLTLP